MPLTKPTRAEIEQKVIELAAAQAGVKPAEVTPAHHFFNDLEFDSLDVVEFIMALEDAFHVSFPDADAEQAKVLEDVIRYLVDHFDGEQ